MKTFKRVIAALACGAGFGVLVGETVLRATPHLSRFAGVIGLGMGLFFAGAMFFSPYRDHP